MNLKMYILCSLFLLISCKENHGHESTATLKFKPEKFADDQTIYSFINYAFKSNLRIFNNCDNVLNLDPMPYFSEQDSIAITKLDSLFTKEDLNFIFKQAQSNVHFGLNPNFIADKNIIILDTVKIFNSNQIVSDKYFAKLHEKYNVLCSLSIPIFSLDRNTVIVKISYGCGMLCGEGGIYIYSKIDNETWELTHTLSEWIS